MAVTVETLEKLERKITLTLPVGSIQSEVESRLKKMARKQARRMARKGRMFHQPLGKVQNRCDVGWAGENVAYGFGTGKAVVKAWIKSPGHRENILRPQFESMGIAAVRRNGVWWVAQVFGTEA